MNANRVFQSARRSNLNKLFIGILLLIVVFSVAFITQLIPFFIAKLQPPQDLSITQLRNLEPDQLPLYNVRVVGEEMIGDVYYTYTELNYIIEVDRRNFGVLLVGNELLMVESSLSVTDSTETVGALYTMPDEVKNNVVRELIAETPQAAGSFLPLLLTNVIWTWIVGLVVAVLATLFALNNIVLAIARYANSNNHPVVKRLARYGYVRDVAEDVAADLNINGKKVGKIHMGKTWLVYHTSNDFSAVKWADITAYHKDITVGRYNSKGYAVRVNTINSEPIIVPAKQKQVDEMLAEIALRAPQKPIIDTSNTVGNWESR
jgi:hypothetical protein